MTELTKAATGKARRQREREQATVRTPGEINRKSCDTNRKNREQY